MSMLAERRRKHKLSPNPCGKWWSEDSNKFGQRMLEKMGWSKGKGLGINEQGITQHINVSQKNDTAGLGYDKNESWTIYEKQYNELLQQLGAKMNDTDENLKSKCNNSNNSVNLSSKQKTNYQKVKQCKDISKYTSKDLANIFGQKEQISEDQSKVKKEDTICARETIGTKNNNYGVITFDGGSMVDYFKRKSNSFTNNGLITELDSSRSKPNESVRSSICTSHNTENNSDSENEQRVGFGFPVNKENAVKENVLSLNCKVSNNLDEKNNYAFDNPCLSLNSPDTSEVNYSIIERSSKKRKKRCENDSLHTESENCSVTKKLKTGIKDGITNLGLDLDMKSEENCNGREFEVPRIQLGVENHGFVDVTGEPCAKKRVTFNNRISVVEFCVSPSQNLRKIGKKLKTKGTDPLEHKKKKNWIWVSATTVPLPGDFPDNELNLSYVVKEKKKRKIPNKESNLETIQESPEPEIEVLETKEVDNLNADVIEIKETDIASKKSKKKKKQKTAIENTATVNNKTPNDIKEIKKDENIKPEKQRREEVESSVHKKKKKKKNKNISKIETEISNDQDDIKILDEMSLEQQQNTCLTKNKNTQEDTTEVEALSVTVEEKEKKELSENAKPKKKKRKIVTEDEKIVNSVSEKAVSDKENTGKEETSSIKKLAKKKTNDKKTKDVEFTDTTTIDKQEKIENTEFNDTSLHWINNTDSIGSPYQTKTKERMSKKLLVALYHRKAILDFPGSNIYTIKGYGVDTDY